MSERPEEVLTPTWVGGALLVALAGGVFTVVAEVLDKPTLGVVGLTVFVGGIIAISVSSVVYSRRTGVSLRSAIWKGFKTAGSLLWQLAP